LKTEKQLRAELHRLNKDIASKLEQVERMKQRRDMLQQLFPHPETPAPRIEQKQFAIGH
jgi:hypothetical protein